MSLTLGNLPGAGVLGGIAGTISEIPAFQLTLGPVTFQNFEIPPELSGGGAHFLVEHKYPGGARTIDTFGPDYQDPAWSGYFTGDAEDRCQMLNSLARQGQPQQLDYSTFSFIVVIKSFTWRYERPWKIAYSIALSILQDNNNPPTQAQGISFDDQVNSDAADAASNTTLMMGALY